MNDMYPLCHASAERRPAIPPPPGTPPAVHNHHKAMVWAAMLASMICAAGAGFGLAAGLLSPADGVLTGYAVPIIAGIVLAVAIAAGWHMLQTAAPRVRTPLGIVGVLAGAFLLAAITIGASSWGVATSLSGPAAERAYQADQIVLHRQALAGAWAGAQREVAVVDAVATAATEMRGLAEMEGHGDFSNTPGRGPNMRLLQAAADRYEEIAAQMRSELARAGKLRERGEQLLQAMQQARRRDPEAFGDRASELAGVVADLNAFHISPQAKQGGISRVEVSFDPTTVRRIRSGADAVTTKVLDVVQAVDVRQPTPIPEYVPIEQRDATLRYASTAAVGGFITAVAIDLAPAIFTIILLLTAREELLLRQKSHTPTTRHPDYDTHAANA